MLTDKLGLLTDDDLRWLAEHETRGRHCSCQRTPPVRCYDGLVVDDLQALRAAARAVIAWHNGELEQLGGMLWARSVPAIEALSKLVPDE